ncbi:metallophosphoesterase [Wenyingzhuangia sp. IMCC45574]
MKRRSFIKKGILGTIGASILTGIYAWRLEPYWLEFVKVKMPVKNLPNELIGRKLIQISDIHVGNRFDWNYIIDSFKKAQKLNPDFVVYTGDYVSYENEKQFEQLKEVLKHTVKGTLGTVGVLGNHDYGSGFKEQKVANSITQILEQAGIEVLRNQQREYHGLTVIGIDDFWGTNFFPKKVTSKIHHNKANLALCHNPDVCDLDVWNDYKGWILSGHTHGGQVKPPFLPAPMLPVKNKKYGAGKIDLNDGRTLYINRALGNLYPVRFNVRPEITVFELAKA